MSNTRYRAEGTPRPQERWASHPEFERGLLGNLVAKRAAVISSPEDRKLLYFLQLLSWEDGGIAKLANELLVKYPERVATVEMQQLRIKPGQTCDAAKVRKIRNDIPCECFRQNYPLRGEIDDDLLTEILADAAKEAARNRRLGIVPKPEPTKEFPASYPASVFFQRCMDAARDGLKGHLEDMCLNPGIDIYHAQPWFFPYLIATLREVQAEWIKARNAAITTKVGERVSETLDFCLQGRCLVVLEGIERIGKTFSTKQWCYAHPGESRFAEVPPSNDDITFFRALAGSVGVSVNLNSKAHELRARVEAVLNEGHIMLVLDEAQRLWPHGRYREALPYRVEWVSQLVNRGIPVALVATPQFLESQRNLKRRLNWRDGQFTGRLAHYEPLPDSLPREDLIAIARLNMPEGDKETIEALVSYAMGSAKYIAGIEHVVKRARFLAERQGRSRLTRSDIKNALKGSVIPSDTALTRALDTTGKTRRAVRVSEPFQETLTAPEKVVSESGLGTRPSPIDAVTH